MRKSKQAAAREFSKKTRDRIIIRDRKRCFFCTANYRMEKATPYSLSIFSIMHYIPRSKNGLGIEENGALGCQYHHEMLDNGNAGNREEMLGMFERYLRAFYPNWDRDKLIYNKWR